MKLFGHRPWLACIILAAATRGLAAVVIQRYPFFPAHYYEDARRTDQVAWNILSTGRVPEASPSIRAHAYATALFYKAFGRRRALAGALGGVAASAGIVFLAAQVSFAFGPAPALATAALWSLWPSGIFYTSQNLKEPWVIGLCCLSLGLLLRTLQQRGRWRTALGAALALSVCGLLRAYVLGAAVIATSFVALLFAARRRRATPELAAILAASVMALMVFKGLGVVLYEGPLRTTPGQSDGASAPTLIPTEARSGRRLEILSARSISAFRADRQRLDRKFARDRQRREIGTQIYPDARFETWLDIAAFLPKAAFHVLFMPLPGLYPLEGKLGRVAAAAENVVLLGLAVAAAFRLTRRSPGPTGALLLAFFTIMALGTAPFEFDLGSAARHKLLYLPMIFPFAFGAEKVSE